VTLFCVPPRPPHCDFMAPNASTRQVLFGIAPAIMAGIAYEICLGHRHDYTGHFLAGYGGTYGAALVWLKTLSLEKYQQSGPLQLVIACLACILLGIFLEATAFRIAKFDEVDFFNQSLGAVLAAVVAMGCIQQTRPADRAFDYGLITGIAFLGIGACYAIA
jgi:hypothetical protein